VPSWLATASAWAWRLLLLAVVIYLISRILGILYIVVLPCIAALLLTAVLQPLTSRLRRAGLPALAATWVTLLIAALVLGGLVLLVANRVSADYPTVLAEAKHTSAQVQSWLAGPPFHVKNSNVQKFLNNIPSYLSKHKSLVEGTVVTGGKIATEFFGGLVLMLFVTFFLIKDGERIWNWLLGAMRTGTARRMDRAGHASWLVLVYYMRGTVAVAAIHAVVVGVALSIMGVPLALPLILATAFVVGASGELFSVNWVTTMQQEIPPAALSRVSAYDALGSLALAPVGTVVAGPLLAVFGPGAVLDAGGVLILVVTLLVLAVPEVRQLRRAPAPAAPEPG